MENTIIEFVGKILEEKGVTGLPEEVVDQMRNDLVERAENLINAEILAHMPREVLEEFEKKLDAGNEEEIQKFCQQQISNLDEIVAGSLIKLKSMYLGN